MKFIVALALAAVAAATPQLNFEAQAPGYNYAAPQLQGSASTLIGATARNPIAALAAAIPGDGVPGQDYPILASVPFTSFSCLDQQFSGYFADTAPESSCQVFHICQFDGRQDSFLCPNGTLFNQQYFVCDWWFNVDCAATQQFVSLNADIGRISKDSVVGSASSSFDVQKPSGLYSTPQ